MTLRSQPLLFGTFAALAWVTVAHGQNCIGAPVRGTDIGTRQQWSVESHCGFEVIIPYTILKTKTGERVETTLSVPPCKVAKVSGETSWVFTWSISAKYQDNGKSCKPDGGGVDQPTDVYRIDTEATEKKSLDGFLQKARRAAADSQKPGNTLTDVLRDTARNEILEDAAAGSDNGHVSASEGEGNDPFAAYSCLRVEQGLGGSTDCVLPNWWGRWSPEEVQDRTCRTVAGNGNSLFRICPEGPL